MLTHLHLNKSDAELTYLHIDVKLTS